MRWWLIFFLATTISCDRQESDPAGKPAAPPQQRIQVLASVYAVAEMAQRVGGDLVDVQWLPETGQRPEDVDPSADLRQRANRAAFVVIAGPWDRWAFGELTDESRARRVVEPERMPSARTAAPGAYLWLDPAVMRDLTDAVRERLAVIDPAHEAAFRANATAYRAEIDAVDREMSAALGGSAGRRVITVRPAWAAMAARYGLVTAAPSPPTTEERLSATDFKTLAAAAKQANARAVYVDAATPPAVRQRIADQTKLTVHLLDATGTSALDGRSTWPRVMRFNLSELRKAME